MSSREDLIKIVKGKLARYCSVGERSPAQVLKKITASKLSHEESQAIMDFLRKEKFLDERRFAAAFCNDKLKFNKWGKTRLKIELYAHKVADDIIHGAIENIDEEAYIEVLSSVVRQKWRQLSAEKSLLVKKKKTIDYAMRKGFSISDIQPLVLSLECEQHQ